MNVSPHYLLLSESSETIEPGRWRFVLRAMDGSRRLVVDEVEPEIRGDRLELLTVVRGLESLDEPSCVTLVTRSTYIREGIRYGMSQWRKNGWRWESFGRMVPVKNSDLWQRIDRAMQFHRVDCRVWRFDSAHVDAAGLGMGEGDSGCCQLGHVSNVPKPAIRHAGNVPHVVLRQSRVWLHRMGPIWATLTRSVKFGRLFCLARIADLAKVQRRVRYRCAKHPAGRWDNGT